VCGKGDSALVSQWSSTFRGVAISSAHGSPGSTLLAIPGGPEAVL
jgi:hypothetical protein